MLPYGKIIPRVNGSTYIQEDTRSIGKVFGLVNISGNGNIYTTYTQGLIGTVFVINAL